MNNTKITHYQSRQYSTLGMDGFARKAVIQLLGRLQYGTILLHDFEGQYILGTDNDDETLRATITVHSPKFYRKVLFGGSIGAGEAYIEGLFEVDDLTRLIRIMARNMSLVDKMEEGLAWLLWPFRRLSHIFKSNSRRGARKNILAHYDLGNELYSTFLDPTMMYSSAIFPHNDSSLEEASLHKLETICRKLRLQRSDHLLEIGTGWGGLAIFAAQQYGCRVTTTTISDAQYQEARKRIEQAGVSEYITLVRKDYRDLTGKFDKLISIEMIEAVGYRYLTDFFKKCGILLHDDGAMLLQAITIQDQKFKSYARSVDFIQRHIFPGGCLVSNRKMVELIAQTTNMVVRGLDDYGIHYARTLQEWRRRFNSCFSQLKEHGFDEQFRRLWEFYLCYCEGGFRERSISVVQLVATKPDNRSII